MAISDTLIHLVRPHSGRVHPATSRWVSLLVLCAGFLMIVVDATIVNVALPSIQRDLGFSLSSLAWVVNAYLIAYGGVMLLAGRLGDLLGRKRVFLIGLLLFTAASLLCGLSFSQPLLIVARFVQGVGGAVSSVVILSMIVTLFPEPGERARAFGIFSFVASAGASVGLLAGGVITQALSWHWIFFVNLPIGVATALLAVRLLDADLGLGLGQGADLLGAALVTGSLMLGVFAIVTSSTYGLGSAHTLGFGALALGLLVAFGARQMTARNPILPPRVFRVPNVAASNVIQLVLNAAFMGFFFIGSLDLERVLRYGPLALGLAFLPVALGMGAFSLSLSPRIIVRIGTRASLLAGQALIAIALVLLALGPVHGEYARDILVSMVLLGVGAGLAFPALTMLAMAAATPSDAGLASGVLNTTGQVGGALGLAILATLAASRTVQLATAGQNADVALSGGYHLAWGIGAALVLVTMVLAATWLRSDRRASADGARGETAGAVDAEGEEAPAEPVCA
ncbi:MAG TPA: MFS transporter [Ktedonobacterales bacterium]